MEFKSINPYNGKITATFREHTGGEINAILDRSRQAFVLWREVPARERVKKLLAAAALLRENTERHARTITLEMGKPIRESRAEVLKCALVCEYYAEHAEAFLREREIKTDAARSFVRHDPIGCVLAIMPWNFPFWQVFRFAAPALAAGNTVLLKHAPNVFGCALEIAGLLREASFPEGVFGNLIIRHDKVERIIAGDAVQAVTLTGSERAGRSVAALAGKYLKKCVLELGGSNAFIVWADADMDSTVKTAVAARMMNAGQSCIAAKRFIVVEKVYDAFVSRFIADTDKLRSGDPMKEDTDIGPLARKDLADNLQRQIRESVGFGAKLLAGGKQDGAFHEPAVLGDVLPGMPAFEEETFGPLAAMTRAASEDEAYDLAAKSRYGLGMTVCTKDTDRALRRASDVKDGAFFVNAAVKSDPRLPFGGTACSGYGRELSKNGMMEFVNRKTVYVW